MKAHKADALKTVLILIAACVIGYVSFLALVFGPHFLKLRKEIRQRQTHLLCETDYQALLEACREVSRMASEGELKKYEYHIRGNPDIETSRFPQVILDLEPSYIDIGTGGSVRIELVGGFDHFGVNAYPDDFGKPPSGHYGDRKLIEGLWYYDDGYRQNREMYLKLLFCYGGHKLWIPKLWSYLMILVKLYYVYKHKRLIPARCYTDRPSPDVEGR